MTNDEIINELATALRASGLPYDQQTARRMSRAVLSRLAELGLSAKSLAIAHNRLDVSGASIDVAFRAALKSLAQMSDAEESYDIPQAW